MSIKTKIEQLDAQRRELLRMQGTIEVEGEILPEDIGGAIVALALNHDLTRQEIAWVIGVKASAVTDYLNGRRAPILAVRLLLGALCRGEEGLRERVEEARGRFKRGGAGR